MYKCFVFCLALTQLAACQRQEPLSLHPMPMPQSDGPWQLITVDEARIYREVINVEKGRVVKSKQPVYVKPNGLFVFRDGTPIKAFSQHLYWNNQGRIITEQHIELTPSMLFKVNNAPMSDTVGIVVRQVLQAGRANWKAQVSGHES